MLGISGIAITVLSLLSFYSNCSIPRSASPSIFPICNLFLFSKRTTNQEKNKLNGKVQCEGYNVTAEFNTSAPNITNPKGLRNLGNTCYMNAIVQSLFYSYPLRISILSNEFKSNSIGEKLKRAFEYLNHELLLNNKSFDIMMSFARCLSINPNIQEDAEELLLKILNSLDESLPDQNKSMHSIQSMLQIYLEQYINCTNINYQKFRTQRYFDFSLDIPLSTASNFHHNISNMIQHYFQPELLFGENKYKITTHGYQEAMKGLKVVNTSDVLIVHLKRFAYDPITGDMRKVNDPVKIELEIDLNSYVKNDQLMYSSKYELSSIVMHEGTTDFGHYWSFARPDPTNNPKRWIILNDEIVQEIDEELVLQSAEGGKVFGSGKASVNAYILIYSKK
eukprot:gene11299-15159_t